MAVFKGRSSISYTIESSLGRGGNGAVFCASYKDDDGGFIAISNQKIYDPNILVEASDRGPQINSFIDITNAEKLMQEGERV